MRDNVENEELMANVIDERGFFWWFNEPGGQTNSNETSVSGTLTVTEEGHINLILDGALWYGKPPQARTLGEVQSSRPVQWITGRLGRHGASNHVLLCGLERTDLAIMSDPQDYQAEYCITSIAPFSPDFDLGGFRHLRVDLVGLEDWLQLDSIRVGREEEIDAGSVEVRVKYKNDRFSYPKGDANISIQSSTSGACGFLQGLFDLPTKAVDFRQSYELIYTPSADCSLSSLRYGFTQVEDFLALLLGSYFRLKWPIFVHGGDNETWHPVYFHRGSTTEFMSSRWLMWTTFDALRESFGDLFFAWRTQVGKYGARYHLYSAVLRNPLPYAEHRFVNLVWALESLHRKRSSDADEQPPSMTERTLRVQSIRNTLAAASNERDVNWFLERAPHYERDPKLEDRIFDSLSRLPIHFETETLWTFSKRCANRRHAISHEGGQRENETYEDFSRDLWELTDALSYLYHGFLLHEIGLGDKILVHALTKGGLAEMRIFPALTIAGLILRD